MSNNSVQVGGGLSLPTVLFLIFLVLKLTEVIDWSWWWVTAPLWGALAFGLLLLLIWAIASLTIRLLVGRRMDRW